MTECEYDHLTYSRPLGEVKPHYYTMASQLHRSADQLADEMHPNGGPAAGTSKKCHSPHSSSSSSNELNISKPEVNMNSNECQSQNASDEVPKVSNLNVGASDDEYARQKVNNLNVSVDAGKRGAYAKFEDDFKMTLSTGIDDPGNNNSSVAETEALSPDEDN